MTKRFIFPLVVLVALVVAATVTITILRDPSGHGIADLQGMNGQQSSPITTNPDLTGPADSFPGQPPASDTIVNAPLPTDQDGEQKTRSLAPLKPLPREGEPGYDAWKKAWANIRSIVDTCKKAAPEDYSAYYNCTNYANLYHQLCIQMGLDCRTFTYFCPGATVGHAMNMSLVGDEWCIVEPQTGFVYQCGRVDPTDTKSLEAFACEQSDVKTKEDGTCDCKINVYDKPQMVNTNPTLCARKNQGSQIQCQGCCANFKDIKMKYKDGEKWIFECYSACARTVDGY